MKLTSLLIVGVAFAGMFSLTSVAMARARAGHGGATIDVLFDRGLDGMTLNQQNQLNQLSDFLEPNLLTQFRRAGYTMKTIISREQFQASPGRFLLIVKTVNYNPGSKAARMVVGFGAGSTSLDVHFEVYGEDDQPLLSKDHGRRSTLDWQNVCRALNKDIVRFTGDAVNAR